MARLKQDYTRDIVVYGSLRLVRTLFGHDLVDELRLLIYPVVLGAGERLFGETNASRSVRLVDTRPVGDVAMLTYRISDARRSSCGN